MQTWGKRVYRGFLPEFNYPVQPKDALSVYSFMSELFSKQLKQPLHVAYLQTRAWSILHFHVFNEELRVAKKFSYAKEIRPNWYKLTHPKST